MKIRNVRTVLRPATGELLCAIVDVALRNVAARRPLVARAG